MTRTLPLLLLLGGCLITEDDHTTWLDQDGDGVQRDIDCDDEDASVGAGGEWYADGDGDGWAAADAVVVEACTQPSGYTDQLGDCDDGSADAHPGGVEEWYDGVDGDCDGADDFDQDGDGWPSAAEGAGDDCDDLDPQVNPSAFELVDGVDNNCDGDSDFLRLDQADAVLLGEDDQDKTGASVAGLGDVNGDGFDDLLVGTDHPANTDIYGKAFLVLGPVDGEIDLASEAIRIEGTRYRDKVGYKVAGAGDTDNDGLADFLVGGQKGGVDETFAPGEAYLFLGAPSLGDLQTDAADLVVQGVNDGDQLGYEIAGRGDLDGDGLADWATTAIEYANLRGKVYVALGASAHRGVVSAGDLDAGFTGLDAGDRHGRGLAMGDLNGDGFDELITGAKEHDAGGSSAGAVFLLDFAGSVASRDMGDVDATILGEKPNSRAGGALAVADLDADGYADLLVGAETNTVDGASNAGTVYLIPGGAALPGGDLGDATTRMDGDEGCRLGRSVAIPGDLDGDGTLDLALAGPECSIAATSSGGVMILLGSFEGTLDLGDADIVLAGASADHTAGWSVDGAGDVDADSFADLIVGAPDESGGPGFAYLMYGREF